VYELGEAEAAAIKPSLSVNLDYNFDPIDRLIPVKGKAMDLKGAKMNEGTNRRQERTCENMAGTEQPRRGGVVGGGSRPGSARAAPNPVGLLMAAPGGGGEQGGLAERPTRPKPSGGVGAVPLLRQRAFLEAERDEADAGNWDGGDNDDASGFRQGAVVQVCGIVDMEDAVHLEFEEEDEEMEQKPDETVGWMLVARYMANFKPNTKAMFTFFSEEAWHLRTRIDYAEKGQNIYMITLYSKGDYDFVKKGGPCTFKQNALIVKDYDKSLQPSEIKFDAVPVWVRIYNVPFEKQDKAWGMRYGNGLGEALEVDVPASELKKHGFLRARVNLPYDRRLQTQISTGIKGKPWTNKVFKLKYERVPYYCSHCGFMGHKKDECEKKKMGTPSLDYDAIELRCSPYKKFEYRSHSIPAAGHASARRGLSFSSFGSAESRKVFSQEYDDVSRRNRGMAARERTSPASSDEMPPLEDDIIPGVIDAYGNRVGHGTVEQEEETRLAAKVEAMQMDTNEAGVQSAKPLCSQTQGNQISLKDASLPLVEFPDEEDEADVVHTDQVQVTMTKDMLAKLQQAQSQAHQVLKERQMSQSFGPRQSDMISALQGLSSLQVSFGSVNDVSMQAADTVLGKRAADEEEVQGEQLDLSLGMNYGQKKSGGTPKKGRMQEQGTEPAGQRPVARVYTRNKNQAPSGHKPTGHLTRPNVWSRQAQ
jgi:hypothetical protein